MREKNEFISCALLKGIEIVVPVTVYESLPRCPSPLKSFLKTPIPKKRSSNVSTYHKIHRIFFQSGRNVIGPPVKLQRPSYNPKQRQYHKHFIPNSEVTLNDLGVPRYPLYTLDEEYDDKACVHESYETNTFLNEFFTCDNEISIPMMTVATSKTILSNDETMILSQTSSNKNSEYGDVFDDESDHGLEEGSPLRQFYGASLVDYNR